MRYASLAVLAVTLVGSGLFAYGVHQAGKRAEITHGPRVREITPQMLSTADEQAAPPKLDTPTAVASVDPGIVPQASVAGAQFGIAAGGALGYLGQSDLDKYFADLSALGAKWVRWDLDWNIVQPSGPTAYQWEAIDRVQATAEKNGVQSLAILTYTPPWARQSACSDNPHCAPADPAAFGRFAGAAAGRYKGRINYWEVWNEPNFTFFWLPQPNVSSYISVLRSAHSNIKAANSSATVLSGGLAASGDEPDGSIAPITFIRALYTQQAQGSFDAVSLHPYTFPAVPSYQAWWNRWQQIDPIRNLMVASGDANKKVWLTEFGAPTGGPGQTYAANQLEDFTYGQDFMGEAAQQTLLQEAAKAYQDRIDWMGPFFWYSLKDEGQGRSDPENFFGLLRYDGSKKPAYTTYQNLIK